jgi:hypothetical protein
VVKKISLAIALFLMMFAAPAQEITPFGKFLQDSIKIGNGVQYSLSVKYPIDWEVIFPDSTYNFEPFEFYSKSYFPTRTDSTFAYDSAVYTISTFEIDLVQKIQLPIYLLNGKDSTEILANPDSIYLVEMVAVLPDSLAFRENLSFQIVDYAFNYPYFMIGLGIFIALTIGSYFIFGQTIRRKIKVYRLRKAYENFSLDFESGINKIKRSETSKTLIEEILVVWKKYMEQLEDRPFTKYTSKEIIKIGFEKELKSVLQNIDQAIYGSLSDEEMHKNFENLEDFTLVRYQLKLKEVQND